MNTTGESFSLILCLVALIYFYDFGFLSLHSEAPDTEVSNFIGAIVSFARFP